MFQPLDLTLSWHQVQSQEDTRRRMAETRAKRAHGNPSFVVGKGAGEKDMTLSCGSGTRSLPESTIVGRMRVWDVLNL